MTKQFLAAVEERDLAYVSENVGDMSSDTLKKALSKIKNTIRLFNKKGSDYSDDIAILEEMRDIIDTAL